ncbi:alpha/beta hydrolase fold-domain-containing protein [Chlamydoabsidia padenii]|nr:alpha/beta hydrolase fold-domain-containing protein [Chlamydoabsidia padenii]
MMIPSSPYLIFAFILVIFGTKNGRKILTQRGIPLVREAALYIPYSIRRRCFRYVFGLPLPILKTLVDVGLKPLGREKSWIRPQVISPHTTAHWIGQEWETPTIDLDLIILFFHGGVFTTGNSTIYMQMFMTILTRLNQRHGIKARIFSVDYPLAPAHPYPQAQESCLEAYQYLVHTLSISPSRIILAGDSSGGNLVATLLLNLCDQRTKRHQESLPPLPQPAGGVLVSPWVNLTTNSPSTTTNETYDVLSARNLAKHTSAYLSHDELTHPMVSPVYGSYVDVTCPLLVTCSDHEIFQYDILKFIDQARQDKVHVEVLNRQDQPHNWIVEPLLATSMDIWKQDVAKVTDWMVGCII